MEQGTAMGLTSQTERRPAVALSDTTALLLLAALALLLTALFYAPTDNWRWDPSFYYAQLRAPLIERRLDFRPETIPHNGVPDYTANGLQPSPWPIGPGLLWAPFFLAAQLYMWLSHGGATGFEPLFVAAVSAGSALYGILGLLLLYRICRCLTTPPLALLSAALLLLATPLFYYIYRQPIMAHSTSLLASASLLLVSLLAADGRLEQRYAGLALGVCIGLNVLLRWTSLLLAIVPLGLWLAALIEAARQRDRPALGQMIVQFGVACLAAAVTVLPQLALWHQLHGRWLVFPSQGFSSASILGNLGKIFLGTNRGLLWWSPALLLGLLSLALARPRALRIAALLYLLAQLGVLSLWHDWYGGGGFGPRYFIETLPLAALGLAALLDRLGRRRATWLAAALLLVLSLHQLVLVTIIEQGWAPMQRYYQGQPLGLGVQLSGLARILGQPADLFLPRPGIAPDRQALLLSLLSGQSGVSFYLLPLLALVVIGLGLVAALLLARTRWVALGAALLACYLVGWSCFLLTL